MRLKFLSIYRVSSSFLDAYKCDIRIHSVRNIIYTAEVLNTGDKLQTPSLLTKNFPTFRSSALSRETIE